MRVLGYLKLVIDYAQWTLLVNWITNDTMVCSPLCITTHVKTYLVLTHAPYKPPIVLPQLGPEMGC